MPTRYPPDVVLNAFQALNNTSDPHILRQFLNEYFEEAGSEVIPVEPM